MKDATLVTVAGRDPERQHGVVNPAVYRASTVLFPTLAALEAARPGHGVYYGRYGTPTTFALQEAITRLEGGDASIAVGSGKTAITAMLLSLLRSGDHLLVTDSVYAPTRAFCQGTLARLGIDLNEVGETLQVEGVKLFMQSFDELLGLLAAPASTAA